MSGLLCAGRMSLVWLLWLWGWEPVLVVRRYSANLKGGHGAGANTTIRIGNPTRLDDLCRSKSPTLGTSGWSETPHALGGQTCQLFNQNLPANPKSSKTNIWGHYCIGGIQEIQKEIQPFLKSPHPLPAFFWGAWGALQKERHTQGSSWLSLAELWPPSALRHRGGEEHGPASQRFQRQHNFLGRHLAMGQIPYPQWTSQSPLK